MKIPKNYSGPISFIRYADDFLVLCESEDDAKLAQFKLVGILKNRLSSEKTNICQRKDGFDFLGCQIRLFKINLNIAGNRGFKTEGYTLIIKPSPTSLMKIREKLKLIFDAYKGTSTSHLVAKQNPVIRGWSNYY